MSKLILSNKFWTAREDACSGSIPGSWVRFWAECCGWQDAVGWPRNSKSRSAEASILLGGVCDSEKMGNDLIASQESVRSESNQVGCSCWTGYWLALMSWGPGVVVCAKLGGEWCVHRWERWQSGLWEVITSSCTDKSEHPKGVDMSAFFSF